jgi:TetR/AcrR family transcriptional regulator, regulator of mycofactocin system
VTAGLRERKKLRLREELIETATRLFDEHGFDAVTIDQIAEAAFVSPRTFFRYFESKEAVLFGDQEEILDRLRETIADHPPGSSLLDVLRQVVTALASEFAERREHHLHLARLAETGPSVAAYQLTVLRPRWEETIASALAARLGVGVDVDLRPRLFAGAALAVIGAVGGIWTATDGSADVDSLLEEAFDMLAVAGLSGRGADA